MKSRKLLRVHNQELSWWQSIVTQYVIDEKKNSLPGEQLSAPHVQNHPMVVALNTHVKRAIVPGHRLKKEYEPKLSKAKAQSMLSEIAFHIAKARIRKNAVLEAELHELYRKYSNDDPEFAKCAATYAAAYLYYGGIKQYYDWQKRPHGPDMNFGRIGYQLPNNAKVAIIGDWGTGMEDAKYLLKAILSNPQDKPDAIIHLGDIYYSATQAECSANFSAIIDEVFNEVLGSGVRIPVFGIPGNHDYYSMGYAYYDMINGLNSGNAQQTASYFCLTTADNGWQFLGMDTGYDDANPGDAANTTYAGPQLYPTEYEWHFDKLNRFNGATIVLSHHQLFSARAKINGYASVYSSYPNINKYLLENFQPFFGTKIAGWLWGHEHNQVIYANNNFGLMQGRLIGASAYEEALGDDPDTVSYPDVPVNAAVRLGATHGYFNHGYVIVDFGVRTTPTSPVLLKYYEYPSWDDTCRPEPIPPLATLMYSERMALPQAPDTTQVINYGSPVNLNPENGFSFIGPFYDGSQYYPTLGAQPVNMQITGGSGPVKDGDMVQIMTLEAGVASYNMLGVWRGTTEAYYYYQDNAYGNQNWIIKKINGPAGSVIHENEAVCIISGYYPGQYLCPYLSTLEGMYLSTNASVRAFWFFKLPAA